MTSRVGTAPSDAGVLSDPLRSGVPSEPGDSSVPGVPPTPGALGPDRPACTPEGR
ncbi:MULTISPECIES: hypothetical protein [Streptomyces]|uniref:hypothetical protein n=1 Tax=Streptomyces TaxID=1883 RepID=UPI003CF550ED